MQHDHAYRSFQILLLREFHQNQLVAADEAVEDFVRLAEAQSISIDALIRMAESGMTGQQIAEAVIAGRDMPATKTAGS